VVSPVQKDSVVSHVDRKPFLHEVKNTSASESNRLICPRCESQLRINYDEPQCIQCGYVDYSYSRPQAAGRKKALLSSGRRYVLRYVGDSPVLSEQLIHVQLHRVRNRVLFEVDCPFCHQSMMRTSLSGRLRANHEERYRCNEGHMLSIVPVKKGWLGWK
jgi:hypothetical protein